MKGEVKIPLITTNRINDPGVADDVIARGDADMVSMARPFLADADFVAKARSTGPTRSTPASPATRPALDHIFERKIASCLVNPFACRETEFNLAPVAARKKVAVVGAGPAGLACATTAAERGARRDAVRRRVRGRWPVQSRAPDSGKEEFAETLRYFRARLARLRVKVELNRQVRAAISRASTR